MPRLADLRDRALAAYVRRASDATLERRFGVPRGQALLLGALARRYDRAAAPAFAGELQIDLRGAGPGGAPAPWAIAVPPGDGPASARPGPAEAPAVTVTVGIADLLRVGTGERQADRLVLDGAIDLAGDWGLASRLGALFGRR